jgi:hypothetical protein
VRVELARLYVVDQEGVSHGSRSRAEALSQLQKGHVTVSGYKVRPEALRVIVEEHVAALPLAY